MIHNKNLPCLKVYYHGKTICIILITLFLNYKLFHSILVLMYTLQLLDAHKYATLLAVTVVSV
jgi:hypothetical protein